MPPSLLGGYSLCSMGAVAKMMVITGLAQTFSFLMIDLSGGHLLTLLLLIGVVCILFGLVVSTLVAYLLVVLMAAPTLVQFGIDPVTSHFTVFYLAILSALTPPVAAAVAVACTIAKAPFVSTAFWAIKIGLPFFLLPFIFIYKPNILAANLTTAPLAGLEVLVGFLAIVYAIHSKSKGLTGFMLRFLFGGLGAVGVFSSTHLVSWPSLAAVILLAALVLLVARKRAATGAGSSY